jgi:hypothetical protein
MIIPRDNINTVNLKQHMLDKKNKLTLILQENAGLSPCIGYSATT